MPFLVYCHLQQWPRHLTMPRHHPGLSNYFPEHSFNLDRSISHLEIITNRQSDGWNSPSCHNCSFASLSEQSSSWALNPFISRRWWLVPCSLWLGFEMFGDCGLRIPFPRRRQPAAVDPEPELDPVLLVSGIGGSILNARNKKSGFLTRVWVRVFLANLEFKKNVWSLYNPETGLSLSALIVFFSFSFYWSLFWIDFDVVLVSLGYTESVDPNVEILVPDDDYGLYAIDILDPAWVSWIFFSLNAAKSLFFSNICGWSLKI